MTNPNQGADSPDTALTGAGSVVPILPAPEV